MCVCECVDSHIYILQTVWPSNLCVGLYDRYLVARKLLFTYTIAFSPLAEIFPVWENNGNELLLS